jgi:mannose-6-phosphate isomerase
MRFYPLKFRPILKRRIWGGQKLRELGKEIAEGEKIGESWELADLPEDKSLISNGELAGQTLSSVIQKYPKEITGDENFTGAFPLLIKFLDAQDILSVQVHPNEQACERMGKGEPKTECWYIIASEPSAVIYKGLKKGVTKQQFAEAIREGDVAELLEEVVVEAGQCHFLPAGTAHSIGAGLLIAEIQTPSDTTYRVFDFNRVDDTGKARPLHIEEALESIHFERGGEQLSVSTIGRLVDCEYFKIDKGHQAEGCELLLSAGVMKTMIFLTGCGIIDSVGQKAVEFKGGDTLLVPYSYEGAIRFTSDTEYLTVTV